MRNTRRLRIAILAHSTNPRGGVVHALELGDALARLGHDAVVHAPDVSGDGFFRETICGTIRVPASPAGPDTRQMVEIRVADYLRYFSPPGRTDFDVWHAQDGISANALAALKQQGRIRGFARTLHHVDSFADPVLAAMQRTAIIAADELFVVSPLWRDWLARELGRDAAIVGNGVDLGHFATPPDGTDTELRAQLSLPNWGPLFLSVGGVEARKNTVRILEAFMLARQNWPQARLVIAGGASLLDHSLYQTAFGRVLAASGLPEDAVIVTGPLPQRLMPALYRAATLLLFPSLKEGFGLVVLEAMAAGVPVLTSRIQPFTDYLDEGDVVWCDPRDTSSIAAGIAAGMRPARRALLSRRGLARAAANGWAEVATRHLEVYAKLLEPAAAIVARGLVPRVYPSGRPNPGLAPRRADARVTPAHDGTIESRPDA
jgi:glycosyltransferase-like protein